MTKTNVAFGATQETLLIPLWARAIELRQPDPILRDPKSAEMMAAIAYDFEKFAAAKDSQVGCCLRGFMIDRWVRHYLDQYPQGSIVELGAGLNTRFERVDNGQVRWFDLDLPDVMAVRQQFFQESDRRKLITASALDQDWIESVQATTTEPPMFVAEGVLMYLSETQVKQLLACLLTHFPGAQFVFDSMSPLMVKNQKRHEALKHTTAQFTWGIGNIQTVQTWDDRYRVLEVLTFKDLPKNYSQRFSLKSRILSSLPILKNAYRLALVQLGQVRTP